MPVLLAFLTELQAQVEAERVAATRERQQLLLRIQDLEHQLRRRTGPSVATPDAPSLFPGLAALAPLPAPRSR